MKRGQPSLPITPLGLVPLQNVFIFTPKSLPITNQSNPKLNKVQFEVLPFARGQYSRDTFIGPPRQPLKLFHSCQCLDENAIPYPSISHIIIEVNKRLPHYSQTWRPRKCFISLGS
jgi:hypothetical protein